MRKMSFVGAVLIFVTGLYTSKREPQTSIELSSAKPGGIPPVKERRRFRTRKCRIRFHFHACLYAAISEMVWARSCTNNYRRHAYTYGPVGHDS